MEEKEERRALKFRARKDPLNGFIPSCSWITRGKSNAQKIEIIEDLKRALDYVRKRKRLTYPKKYRMWRFKGYWDGLKIQRLRAQLKAKRDPLHKEIRELKDEIARLKTRIRGQRYKASPKVVIRQAEKRGASQSAAELASEKRRSNKLTRVNERLTAKIDSQWEEIKALRATLRRRDNTVAKLSEKKREKIVKVVKEPIPKEVKQYLHFMDTPPDKKLAGYEQMVYRLASYADSTGIPVKHLSMIMQLKSRGVAKRADLREVSNITAKSLEDSGKIGSEYTHAVKTYFLTADGEKIAQDFINKLRYGKV